MGLSSLGRGESHILATVDSVLEVLHSLAGRPWRRSAGAVPVVDFSQGQRLLAEHTDALLGAAPRGRDVRIMVTMPSEAAHDDTLVHDLLEQGMNCMRINCAHDGPSIWLGMIENLRRAERALDRTCRVVMDLAGPKLRTGPIEAGPAVARIRPKRDAYGRVTAPARVWLYPESGVAAGKPTVASLPLPAAWLSRLYAGEKLRLTDARGAERSMVVIDATAEGCLAETTKTIYIVPGTILRRASAPDDDLDRDAAVGDLPASAAAISLCVGDPLVLTRDLVPGRNARLDSEGRIVSAARLGCTIPELPRNMRAGESIWFDDGKIGGVIERVAEDQILVRITQARPGGSKLTADKGINLPESAVKLDALTRQDLQALPFVARHADVVELSFANAAADVEALQRELTRIGGRLPAIVLKIETRRGFESLPEMLLTAMRWPCCGVMIARGDLAIECGFARLAEIQEEILWICEAAHIPVIWATQVLESLAKTGMPSRAEITDAAMAHRAECVMLNKGPHVASAVRALDDILRRMQAHQSKKRAMLRELRLAHAIRS
jgi:pyruvate kinase